MSQTTHKSARRALALMGTVVLAALGAFGAAGAANAAPSDLKYGNIDKDATGSIIIHKHEHQKGTDVTGDPQGNATIPSAALKDVTFTAYELLHDGKRVDLTIPASWDALGALSVDAACSTIKGGTGYTIGDSIGEEITDKDGVATIPVSSIGAYVVCETDAPSTVTDTAAPFIVTIPFPYTNGWLYNVNVYPKNGTSTVEKTIQPQDPNGITLGSTVQFPVTVKVPSLSAGNDFTSFDVVDTLDPKLTPSAVGAGVGVGVLSVLLDGTPVNKDFYEVTAAGQTVTVKFDIALPAVQELLKSAAAKNLVVTFQGVVNAVGAIENEATGFINNPNHENGIGSNKVTSNWGDVKILKTDSSDPAVNLAGAEFQVYAAADPYAADCKTAAKTGSALSVAGKSTFISQADGVATIEGLFVSDSVNPKIDADFRCYVVVETKAPAGFVTPIGADAEFPVAVTIGKTTVGYDLTVKNVQQSVPALPLTGSSGALVMSIIGGALLALGGGFLLVRRRAAIKH